jgi:flagellar basal-body rod protein FlgF
MDRVIYVAMSGAKQLLERQAAIAHNLANVSTAGYRADLRIARSAPDTPAGATTRSYALESDGGADLRPGPLQQTGRDLDLAIEGRGWIALALEDGSEAYTRSGSLRIGPNGLLQTASGHNVMGEGSPIAVPEAAQVTVGSDGTVTAHTQAGGRPVATPLGRIKLVAPESSALVKGRDGLFRLRGGGSAPAEPTVRLAAGMLEGSNVNAVEALVEMIAVARGFEMHMKLLQSAEQNERSAAQLLAPLR